MRDSFLALLAKAPAHGYELKLMLEQTFGKLWPAMNAGQIYTTLARLERDGLVESRDILQSDRPNKRVYELTPEGHAALKAWLDAPPPPPQLKDEFFIKLALARLAGIADPFVMIRRQRRAHMRSLRDLQELSEAQAQGGNPVATLLLEGTILHLEADLRWLELCEARLHESSEESEETVPEEVGYE